MKYFLKKSILYLFVLVTFISMYGILCEQIYSDNELYPGTSKRYWQQSLHSKKYDYAVLGSSRAFGSIDVDLLDSLTEQKGINLGLNGSGFKENYITLKLFLLNRNNIQKIYFQVDFYSFMSKESFTNAFHAYAYLPHWNKDKVIEDILYEEVPYADKLPFYFPYMSYFIYNKYYSPVQIIRSFLHRTNFCSNPEYNCVNGNKIFDDLVQQTNPVQQKTGKYLKFIMNPSDSFYYNKIVELAHENNISLLFYTAPSLDSFDKEVKNYLGKTDNEFYFRSSYNWKAHPELFANHSHLNARGRNLFTHKFGEFLKQN